MSSFLMFLIFLYFFSSALVLYWTIQNLMTILQTLITKRGPLSKDEEQPAIAVSSEDEDEDKPEREELSEEERKYRNLMGLRAKGPVDGKLLEKNYRERLKLFSSKSIMTEARRKRREKKEKLETPMNFSERSISKQTGSSFFPLNNVWT